MFTNPLPTPRAPRAPRSRVRCGGFTLVELLVVLSIMALLVTMVVGVAQRADLQGKQAKDAANLRQIGVAMMAYADEEGGWLPTTAHAQASQSWIYQLQPYLGASFEQVRVSPADPRRERKLKGGGTSFVMNEYTSVDLRTGFGEITETYRNLRRLEAPSETITVFHASDRMGLSALNDHTHSRNWHKGWNAVLADIHPDRFRLGAPAADHTRGSAHYLYADGHVAAMEAAALKALVDRGNNPALPPEGRAASPQ